MTRASASAANSRAAGAETDRSVASLAGKDVTLAWENTEVSHPIDFRGYTYERRLSAVSGGVMIEYDTTKPVTHRIPLFDEVRPSLVLPAPKAGYLVPAAQAETLGALLDTHGIAYSRVSSARRGHAVETSRASEVTFGREPFEGHFETKVKGAWAFDTRDIPAGSLFVPIAQPKARLVMTMLEPTCSESLVNWGFFTTCFEKKEYMEPYVAEQVALQMMKAEPALQAEFLAKLASDATFAASPAARLEFFHRRHPSWDDRLNLYPVLGLDIPPGR